MNKQEEGVYKKKGAAQESTKQEKTDLKKDMEGGMKEAGDVPGKSGVAQRMGFTQNFGAARQNSYAKGAAKVSSIMNNGPAQSTLSKLGTTGLNAIKDIGVQVQDFLSPDPGTATEEFFSAPDNSVKRHGRNTKRKENEQLDASEKAVAEGKSYGSIASYFRDK